MEIGKNVVAAVLVAGIAAVLVAGIAAGIAVVASVPLIPHNSSAVTAVQNILRHSLVVVAVEDTSLVVA